MLFIYKAAFYKNIKKKCLMCQKHSHMDKPEQEEVFLSFHVFCTHSSLYIYKERYSWSYDTCKYKVWAFKLSVAVWQTNSK